MSNKVTHAPVEVIRELSIPSLRKGSLISFLLGQIAGGGFINTDKWNTVLEYVFPDMKTEYFD